MKKTLFVLLAIASLFFGACKKESIEAPAPDPVPERNTQILVRFKNMLDTSIENAYMEFGSTSMTVVGSIPAGATTDYIVFDYFEILDGLIPGSAYLKGTQNGEPFSAWSGNWCGTGTLRQLDPGKYTVGILKAGTDPYKFDQIRFEY